MSESFPLLFGICTVLCLIQLLAALPWLVVVDPEQARVRLRQAKTWGIFLGSALAAGLILALSADANGDQQMLVFWGRLYGSVLQIQLGVNFFVLAFYLMLRFWPRGGAVALAAFREGVRQPMFWLLTLAGLGLVVVTPVIPYFTFGEDYKMVKELGFGWMTLFTGAFAVIAASSSISEEIEGRTAITLMSKPVSRRHFLIGKFAGILLAGFVMAMLMGTLLMWMLLWKQTDEWHLRFSPIPDPEWVDKVLSATLPRGEAMYLLRGVGFWLDDAASLLHALVLGYCPVMILLAIAVALATRLPMLVNIPVCLFVYFLGNLTPILLEVSRGQTGVKRLVSFLAQVFDTVLPGLDTFDLSAAFVRETPLPAEYMALYTAEASLYALMYTAIALLFGLILFEDRDLA
jgi:ABC-type transport system involved in multi-copper enzyme maturation permease subunit